MAARSFKITFRNVTPLILRRTNVSLDHGEFSGGGNEIPPENIPPMSRAEWKSESGGFATGTEGKVTYSTDAGDVFVHWNNPFVGSNRLGVSVPAEYEFQHGSIDGNDANVTISMTPRV